MSVYSLHNAKRIRKDSKPPARSSEHRWADSIIKVRWKKLTGIELTRYTRWYTGKNFGYLYR